MKILRKFCKKYVRIKKRENQIKKNRTEICCKYLYFTLLILFLSMPTTASAQTHPSLLFNDIKLTPGYQHRMEAPWHGWEQNILNSANSSLSRDFKNSAWSSYNRISNRAQFAQDLALAYQITKNTKYAIKAKEALLNLEKGDAPYKMDKSDALRGFSLAYDWVQSYLDASSNTIIRDKLATLADSVYKDLNDGGTNLDYISFSDYHGRAYPSVGIAGLALNDYTNPNKLSLSSIPSDWVKTGTEYLFVNDKLHKYKRSLFSFGFDDSGKHLTGAYKAYVIDDFVWWFQAYSHFFTKNIFNDYPVAKKAFTSELWESMPNHYHNNFITSGNTKEFYHKGILNLLDSDNKSFALNHIDSIENSKLLPYSTGTDYLSGSLLYLVYEDYSSVPRKNPSWTSHLEPDSIYQVFRGNWNDDSDWLSLITWNETTNSNRDMSHHDQLSFEYYGRGDLLLADGGENKYVLDKYYGEFDIHHNTIAIENPRTPFSLATWSNSAARGIYKGDAAGKETPAYIRNLVQTPWMEAIDASSTVNDIIDSDWDLKKSLSSPIQYKRDIFYPNKQYFIIVDRLEGSETWNYRNIFRPTSLNIIPSSGITASEIGHVNGDLTIGSTSYNWLSLPYKKETATGVNTSSIKWTTTNPYGKKVNLNLFSVPSSEIKVTKHVGRIAGYTSKSEVFSPLVYFRTQPAKNLYRITTLLVKYPTEEEKIPKQLSVVGNGNAIQVKSSMFEDYIYSGKGDSSFASFSTNADTLYFRKTTLSSEYTLLNGSYLNYSGATLISLSKKIDYFTLKEEPSKINFKIKGSGTVIITLYPAFPNATYLVKRNGTEYSNWTTDGTKITIKTNLSEHDFELIPTSTPSATSTPKSTPTPTPTTTTTPAPTATATPAPGATSGTVYSFDVESGKTGWTTTGLWHISGNRFNSSSHSFWYGSETTKNYDTGSTNSGGLVSPVISLGNTGKPVLSFMSWYQTESGYGYDKKLVQISVDNGSWTNLKQVSHTQKIWYKEQIDLSAYANKKIRIRFFFDTVDKNYNNYEGWYVDDIKIQGG